MYSNQKKDTVLNLKWNALMRKKRIFLKTEPILHPDSKVFCIGSCFALEIKRALEMLHYSVHPRHENVRVSTSDGGAYISNGRQLVHYNTHCILQEFEKAFGVWKQAEDDYWFVAKSEEEPDARYYQDPYRRRVYARTSEDIRRVTQEFDSLMRTGILESDLYVITLGLTEVWRKKDNGRTACMYSVFAEDKIEFVRSSFEENYANIKNTVKLIESRFPQRKIVLSVSPVPLAVTFADEDVMIANTESKAVLRAVAGRIAREHPSVIYFPSYEMCSLFERFGTRQVYKEDGRHVRPDTVAVIIDYFLEHYSADGRGARAASPAGPFFFVEKLVRRIINACQIR